MQIVNDTNARSVLETHTAKTLGVSPAYFSLLKDRKRPISVTVAEMLGFDVVVTLVPRLKTAPQREPAPDVPETGSGWLEARERRLAQAEAERNAAEAEDRQ